MLRKYTYNIHTYHTLQHLLLDIHQVRTEAAERYMYHYLQTLDNFVL